MLQKLIKKIKFVLTNSGEVQGEIACLGLPYLTPCSNVACSATIDLGANEFVQFGIGKSCEMIFAIEQGVYNGGAVPPSRDEEASRRLVEILGKALC